MRHAVEHYFGGGSELLNMHERLADLLLIALSVSFEDAGNCHMTTVSDSMPCSSSSDTYVAISQHQRMSHSPDQSLYIAAHHVCMRYKLSLLNPLFRRRYSCEDCISPCNLTTLLLQSWEQT